MSKELAKGSTFASEQGGVDRLLEACVDRGLLLARAVLLDLILNTYAYALRQQSQRLFYEVLIYWWNFLAADPPSIQMVKLW